MAENSEAFLTRFWLKSVRLTTPKPAASSPCTRQWLTAATVVLWRDRRSLVSGIQPRKEFVRVEWRTEIEFDQWFGESGISQSTEWFLVFLKRIAHPATNSAGPKPAQSQFDAFGFRVKVGEAPAVENDQILHLIVEAERDDRRCGPIFCSYTSS